MRHKPSEIIRATIQIILFSGMVGLALYEFKNRTQPTPVRYLGAETALKAGNLDGARKEFDSVLKVRPDDLVAYTGVLEACVAANQRDLACEYANRAIKSCNSISREERAGLYEFLSTQYAMIDKAPNQARAVAAAKQALDLAPNDRNLQNNYGYLLVDNSKGKGADLEAGLKVLRAALSGLKRSPNTLAEAANRPLLIAMTEDSYGWALCKNEQFPDAISVLTQAIIDYPQGTPNEAIKVSYYHLGMAYRGLKQTDQAINAFKNALFYDPKYEEALAAMPPQPGGPSATVPNPPGSSAQSAAGSQP